MALLSALGRLFRGKKKNVLRSRVDSNAYDVAQLLLGMLLFTVTFFLFPTSLVYYAFFSSVWLGVLATRGVLWWLITALNNLPVYTAMCVAVAPKRAPAGVHIELLAVGGGDGDEGGVALAERLTTEDAMIAAHVPGGLDYDDEVMAEEGRRGVGQKKTAGRASEDKSKSGNDGDDEARTKPPHHVWFVLKSQSASAGAVLAPFAEAFSMVAQRYSAGAVLTEVAFGEGPPAPAPAAPASPAAAAAASGGGAGKPKAAAPPPAVTSVSTSVAGGGTGTGSGATITPTAKTPSTAVTPVGTWREYWDALSEVADKLCGI
jgi:hypothetical protein